MAKYDVHAYVSELGTAHLQENLDTKSDYSLARAYLDWIVAKTNDNSHKNEANLASVGSLVRMQMIAALDGLDDGHNFSQITNYTGF